MLNTSFDFRRRVAANTKLLVKATLTLAGGAVRQLADDDIMLGTLAIRDAVSGASAFEIGAAITNRCTITLNNWDERFDSYDFTDAILEPSVGVELAGGSVEWVRKGVYHVDQPESYGNTINLESLDNMVLLEVPYSEVNVSLPATCDAIVNAICTHVGVTLATTTFANRSTVIPATVDMADMTCAEVLSYVAQLTGNWARFDAWGRLRLEWYPTDCYEGEDWLDGNADSADGGSMTSYGTGTAYDGGEFGYKRYAHIHAITSSTVVTDDVMITGVRVTAQDLKVEDDDDLDGETYLYGSEGYVLEIADNKLVGYGNAQAIATQIGQRVVGMRFRPLRLSMTADPALEAGDAIIVTDGRQRQYRSYVTSLTFGVGRYESLSCDAETPGRNRADGYSAITRAVVDLRNSIKREKTARQAALDDLAQALSEASGLYVTREVQQDGSTIYYAHDKPTIAESMVVMKLTAEALGLSTDGGRTYPYGLNVDGDAILNRIYAIGLDASYINSGKIVVGDPEDPIFLADLDTNRVRIGGGSSGGTRTVGELIDAVDEGVVDVDVEFATNQSTTTAPADTDTWTTTAPQWRSGWYIWQRVVKVYKDGTRTAAPATCISGRDGSTGTNAATIYLYKKSATKPAGVSSQLTYTFENGMLEGSLSGWSRGVPAGDDVCWVTVATAIGNGATDVINANEWSDPVQLAAGGIDGLSQATIYLFKRSATSSASIVNELLVAECTVDGETVELLGDVTGETFDLSAAAVEPPTATLTYTFESGDLAGDLAGWSRTVPPGDGVVWVTTATAISSEATDSIAASEWAVPAKLAEDGKSVAISKVEYAVGVNGTDIPTTGWVERVPVVAQGYWLWARQTNSDGSEMVTKTYQGTDGEDGTSVAIKHVEKHDGVTTVTIESTDGRTETLTIADGEDGDTGAPGVGGYVHVAWAMSADGNDGFSTHDSVGKLYMGVYTDNNEADSMAPSAYSWSLIKGADGRGVTSTTISYAASSSGSTVPTSGWQQGIPNVPKGQWLWVRTVDTYTDDSTTTTYSKSYVGTDGQDGKSVSIVSSTKTGDTSTVVISDGTQQKTITIKDGSDGDDGAPGADAYTHIAYATSADGSQGFSTSESAGKSYIGMYADHTRADSQRYQDYSWSLIKGADGTNGSSTAVVMLYKRSAAGMRVVGEVLEADEGTVSGEVLTLPATIVNEVLEASLASLTPPRATLTYTFETGVLSGNLEGWSQRVPEGREPCYVISATATSDGPTDTITSGEWAEAARLADNGTSVFVSQIDYAVSYTETQPTTGWSNTLPAKVAEGAWLWTRTTYSDGTMAYTRAKQGEHGTSTYTHIRYSENANGTPMTATPSESTIYIGIFTGPSSTAPDTPSSYTWSRYAGFDGVNSAVVTLYKRSASTPAKPSATLTYTFATAKLTGNLGGWSQTMPTGTDPCWAISAAAVSAGAADTIATSEWSDQVKFVEHGTNQATIRLYKRGTSRPSVPTASIVYTFATGALSGNLAGWSTTIPTTDGTPCWTTQATAIATTPTDTIAATEWVTPAQMVEDGYNQATIYLYTRGTSTPTKPSSAVTYNFSTGSLSSTPPGWSRTVPSGTSPLWVITAVALSTTNTDSIAASNWSSPIKIAENGEDGVSVKKIEEQYYLSTSRYSQTGGSWSTSQATWVSGRFIWTRTKTTWDTDPETYTYTTPILANAINSANESADEAKKAVRNLDSDLYGEEVFNRLTNYGTVDALEWENGQLYINGTYIKARTIAADRLKAHSITADEISTSYVYAGTIKASQITAGQLGADVIYGGTISGDKINGGTISGVTIKQTYGVCTTEIKDGEIIFHNNMNGSRDVPVMIYSQSTNYTQPMLIRIGSTRSDSPVLDVTADNIQIGSFGGSNVWFDLHRYNGLRIAFDSLSNPPVLQANNGDLYLREPNLYIRSSSGTNWSLAEYIRRIAG